MKNILFITLMPIHAGESASVRNRNLISGLISNGYHVDVLTTSSADMNQPSSCWSETNPHIIYLSRNQLHGKIVENHKENIFKKLLLTVLRKIYHNVMVFDSTKSIALGINSDLLQEKEYDIVITSSDPVTTHLIVPLLEKQKVKFYKWIQYWGDPFLNDVTKESIYPEFYLKHVNRKLYSHADKIVFVSPFTLEEEKKHFPDCANRMSFLPIPYGEKEIFPPRKEGKVRLGYFGAYHSKVRNILPLYHACAELKDAVELTIVGNSDLVLLDQDNIRILGRMSPVELRQYEKDCDVYVCVLNKSGTQIPGKLYHNAGTNKPVLTLIDGDNQEEMIAYLDTFNRFLLCQNEVADIKEKLQDLICNGLEAIPCDMLSTNYIADAILKC